MTLQELFNTIGQDPTLVVAYFVILFIVTFVATLLSKEDSYTKMWRYFYSAIIYLTCIPGILAATLLVYSAIFEGRSILSVNVFVYYLPILSMILTIVLLRRSLDLEQIPGFERIGALIMIIVVTFIVILILQKTRIWVMFHGSVWFLVGLFLILFVAFKIGWERLNRSNR